MSSLNKKKSQELETSDLEPNKKDSTWLCCEVCVYKCKKDETMKKHLNTKHGKFKTCMQCKKKYINERTLTEHIRWDHPDADCPVLVFAGKF